MLLDFFPLLLMAYLDTWSLAVFQRQQNWFVSIITSTPPGPHAQLRCCCKTSFGACSLAMHRCFLRFQLSGCKQRLEFSYNWDYFSQGIDSFQLFYPSFSSFICALHLLKKKILLIYLRRITTGFVFLIVQWISMLGRVISLFLLVWLEFCLSCEISTSSFGIQHRDICKQKWWSFD